MATGLRDRCGQARATIFRESKMAAVIDVHTHILAEDTIRLLQKEAPSIGLKLQPLDAESAVLEVAGVRCSAP